MKNMKVFKCPGGIFAISRQVRFRGFWTWRRYMQLATANGQLKQVHREFSRNTLHLIT